MKSEDKPPTEPSYLRTEFLERISHELRGPAGVTLGAIDELELALGPDAGRVQSLLAMARRGARRVLRTAERLHRTGELEGGGVDWSRTPVDVRDLVQQAVQQSELLEGRKAISVARVLPAEPCVVPLDASWMSVAITELVLNAIGHARKAVTVRVERDEKAVVISVTDDGPGFSEPPGPRFRPPRARRGGGLGLSFAIVRDVVAAHEGELLIDPGPASIGGEARGATVRLVLPLGAAVK